MYLHLISILSKTPSPYHTAEYIYCFVLNPYILVCQHEITFIIIIISANFFNNRYFILYYCNHDGGILPLYSFELHFLCF